MNDIKDALGYINLRIIHFEKEKIKAKTLANSINEEERIDGNLNLIEINSRLDELNKLKNMFTIMEDI